MMKNVLILSVWLAANQLLAQELSVKGRVMSALDGKPIKAAIQYKSYPTGSITGRFNDSTYTFAIFGSSKYQITAESSGFLPRTVIVDPKEAINGVITRDIALTISGEAVRLSHLIFSEGKAVIKPESFDELDELVALMKGNPKIEIQLEGHTDIRGNANANLKLSEDRTEAVKKYLVAKGIEKGRIETKAFGGSQPVSREDTDEARALNRRVEMRILKY